MEILKPRIQKVTTSLLIPPALGIKNQHMLSRLILNRIIIIGFLVLIGWCLARGIYYRSLMGIILALTSLGAVIYFLHLIARMKEEVKEQEAA